MEVTIVQPMIFWISNKSTKWKQLNQLVGQSKIIDEAMRGGLHFLLLLDSYRSLTIRDIKEIRFSLSWWKAPPTDEPWPVEVSRHHRNKRTMNQGFSSSRSFLAEPSKPSRNTGLPGDNIKSPNWSILLPEWIDRSIKQSINQSFKRDCSETCMKDGQPENERG